MNPLTHTRTQEIISKAKGKRILVIGDVMLDRSIYTTSTRMTPHCENAPVLDVKETKEYHGGANNTAVNCQSLGANVTVLTVLPKDMKNDVAGVTSYSASCATCQYTVKESIFKDGALVFRMDSGNMKDAGAKVRDMTDSIRILVKDMDAVIISDYAKGVITQEVFDCVVEECWNWEKLCIVNAKPENKIRIHDVGFIQLNDKEAAAYSDDICKSITENNISYALVTSGAKGMRIYDQHTPWSEESSCSEPCPSFCKHFVDGCGAGDTVIAAYTVAIMGEASPEEAMVFASMVAGIAVSKVGTASVTPKEITEYFHPENVVNEVVSEKDWQEMTTVPPKKTVFANGCYDLLHVGHVEQLKAAKALGDKLIVAINSDQRVRALKGEGRPVNKEQDRRTNLLALKCVDDCVIFYEDTSAETILKIRPDIYVKGSEYNVDTIPKAEREACEAVGAKMVFQSPRPEIRTGQFVEVAKETK